MAFKLKRTFNGKRFLKAGITKSKKVAKNTSRYYRSKNKFVRVVKNKEYYVVYTKLKRKN